MNRIPEDIMTLGLIVKTRPYTYENNMVKCNFEDYIELEELKSLKKSIQNEYDSLGPEEKQNDSLTRSFNDDIYFIDYIIQSLEEK